MRGREGQANHSGVAPADFVDELPAHALDAIGSSFVAWFAAGNIGRNRGIALGIEDDSGGNDLEDWRGVARIDQTQASVDGMGPSGKGAEHGMGFVVVGGLIEDLLIEHDDGISPQHERGWGLGGDGVGFAPSQQGGMPGGGHGQRRELGQYRRRNGIL